MSKKEFSTIVNERGFLQDDAKRFVKERFGKEISVLLGFAHTENELRIMSSLLKNIIADAVSDKIQEIKNEK